MPEAAALAYGERAITGPFISAVGKNEIVRDMKRVARRYGVAITHESKLAHELCMLGQDQEVPRPLFGKVASLLAKSRRRK